MVPERAVSCGLPLSFIMILPDDNCKDPYPGTMPRNSMLLKLRLYFKVKAFVCPRVMWLVVIITMLCIIFVCIQYISSQFHLHVVRNLQVS